MINAACTRRDDSACRNVYRGRCVPTITVVGNRKAVTGNNRAARHGEFFAAIEQVDAAVAGDCAAAHLEGVFGCVAALISTELDSRTGF